MKKERSLDHIHNGAIDFYYGLKIETKLSFDKLCNAISDRVSSIIDEYHISVQSTLQDNISSALKEKGLEKTMAFKNAKKTKPKYEANLGEETENIAIEFTEKGIKTEIITKVDNYLNKMYAECEADFEHNNKIYGEMYVNSQFRCVLPPVELELKNSTIVFLEAMLIVFTNNSAILRLTLPINDIDTEPLLSNEINDYILKATPFYGFPIKLEESTIYAIKNSYCKFICRIKKVKGVYSFEKLTNMIFTNHSAMFESVKEIPEDVAKDIYKLSLAPVQERKNKDFSALAKSHINECGYLFDGVAYIVSSMGSCISIIDNDMVNFAKEQYKEDVFCELINDLRRNIEFTFAILLLKKINNEHRFHKTVRTKNNNLVKIKKHYNADIIFISMLQNNVYGSVRDVTSFFEEKMTFFIDAENTEKRMNALNNIIEGELESRTQQLQNFLSIGSLIFTTIFGLPAINETSHFIRKVFLFIEQDIRLITIENFSFITWLIIVGYLLLYVCLKLRKK